MINAREDRISKLPDKLIHHILLYLDARIAVQTCILSKRWKFIWTTLPFLSFDERIETEYFVKFLDSVFFGRNHGSNVLKLKLQFTNRGVPVDKLGDFVNYALKHNVQDLHVKEERFHACDFIKSKSLNTLNLAMKFDWDLEYCWYLPALTSLHLKQLSSNNSMLPLSCLTCLPALRNLCLECFGLPRFLTLPGVRALCLKDCDMPQLAWDLPDLISLELDGGVQIDNNITEFLSTLVNLQNLKLLSCFDCWKDCLICCSQLLYLELRKTKNSEDDIWIPNILIFAPKLSHVNTVGIFSIKFSNSMLEHVYVQLQGCFEDKNMMTWGTLRQYYCHFMFMLGGLGSAKILTLDSDAIKALGATIDLLQCLSSPFHNLKYLKLPQEYKESSICSIVKGYLLGGSAGATIVTTPRQNDVIPIAPVPLITAAAQKMPEVEEVVTDLDSSVGYNGDDVASGEVKPTLEAEQERVDQLLSSDNEVENDKVNVDKEIEAAELEDILTLDKLRKSMRKPAWMKDLIKGKNGKSKAR